MPVTRRWKKLILEMALIVTFAMGLGIVWNYHLLQDVYQGKAPVSSTGTTETAGAGAGLVPVGLAQAKELFEGNASLFVDAREYSAYRQGHIKGAIPLPVGEFDARLKDLTVKASPETTLVVYCSGFGCRDSKIVGEKLIQHGYGEVLIFEGGFPEWRDAGLPVEGSVQ